MSLAWKCFRSSVLPLSYVIHLRQILCLNKMWNFHPRNRVVTVLALAVIRLRRTPARSSVYSMYAIGFISWADSDDLLSHLNCDRQQIVKFRGALRFVTGTQAGRRIDWPGILWNGRLFPAVCQAALKIWRRGHARLTVQRLSDN